MTPSTPPFRDNPEEGIIAVGKEKCNLRRIASIQSRGGNVARARAIAIAIAAQTERKLNPYFSYDIDLDDDRDTDLDRASASERYPLSLKAYRRIPSVRRCEKCFQPLTRINRNLNHEPHEPHEQIRTQSQSLVQNGKDSTAKALKAVNARNLMAYQNID